MNPKESFHSLLAFVGAKKITVFYVRKGLLPKELILVKTNIRMQS